MLSVKQGGIKYHFGVFGMTQPGIEFRSAGPLTNTLLIRPIVRLKENIRKWKIEKYLDLARGLKKAEEHEGDSRKQKENKRKWIDKYLCPDGEQKKAEEHEGDSRQHNENKIKWIDRSKKVLKQYLSNLNSYIFSG